MRRSSPMKTPATAITMASPATRISSWTWPRAATALAASAGKAQQATLLAFAGEAYRNENGITNDLFPDELKTGLSPAQYATCAPVGRRKTS